MTQANLLPSQGTETRASNVVLTVEQWRWIDLQHADIVSSWGTVKKNSLIRALVTIAMESNPDLNGCTDEDDLTDRLRQAIRQPIHDKQTAVINEIEQLLQTLK